MQETRDPFDAEFRRHHLELASARRNPSAMQRFCQTYRAEVCHNFRFQHLQLQRGREEFASWDPVDLLARAYVEIHSRVAPWFVNTLFIVPHTISSTLSAMDDPAKRGKNQLPE